MENCLASRCSESKAAVISGRAANGPSSPDAHYSDISPRSEDVKERRREGENETASVATNSSREEKQKQRNPVSSDASLKLITV